jgi:hypothetical protein
MQTSTEEDTMKKVLIVAALAALAYGGVRMLWGHGDEAAPAEAVATDDRLALDRLWVDHMPRNERDVFHLFAAITEEPIGIFQATSVWKGSFEMFRYEAHGDELRILFPQDGSREKTKVKATACSTRDWDYCLEISGSSRGVKKYYSREGWELDGVHGVGELRDRAELLLKPAAE